MSQNNGYGQHALPPNIGYGQSNHQYPQQSEHYGGNSGYSYPPSTNSSYPHHQGAYVNWNPSPYEAYQIDMWFKDLDIQNRSFVGGMEIAQFFKRSNLSRDVLKSIWQLVDTSNAGHINHSQFTVLIRLISLACSPAHASVVPSMDLYFRTAHENIPIPPTLGTATTTTTSSSSSSSTMPVFQQQQRQQQQHQYAQHVPSAVQIANNGDDDDDEFTEFSSAPVSPPMKPPQPLAAPQSQAVPPANNDNDGDDDMFGPMTDSSVAGSRSVAHKSDNAWNGYGGSHADVAAADDDDFGPMSSAPSVANLMDAGGIHSRNGSDKVSIKGDEDVFGSFAVSTATNQSNTGTRNSRADNEVFELDLMTEVYPVDTTGIISTSLGVGLSNGPEGKDDDDDDDFGELQGVEPSWPKTLAEVSSSSAPNKMSAFDDLVEEDMQVALGEANDDWDEFTAAAVDGEEDKNMAATAATVADDDRADDHHDVPNHQMRPTAVLEPETSDASGKDAIEFEDFEANFADFESSPVVDNHYTSTSDPLTTGTSSRAPPAVPAPPIPPMAAVETTDGDMDDFGEFGDFESSTPMAVASSNNGDNDSLVSGENTPAAGGTSLHNSGSLMDFLSEEDMAGGATITTTSLPLPPSSGIAVPSAVAAETNDLLDFLDDDFIPPPPPTGKAPPLPGSGGSNSLLDDFSFTAEQTAVAVPQTGGGVSCDGIAASNFDFGNDDEDDFGDFNDAGVPDMETLTPPAVVTDFVVPPPTATQQQEVVNTTAARPLVPRPVVVAMAAKTPQSTKPLSVAELDKLCTRLEDKNLFEEAYACAAHMAVCSEMEELNTAKREAMENDELEMALTIKKIVANLSSQLATLAQEYEWIRAADSSRCGPSLRENAELIQALDASAWNKYEEKYLNNQPSRNASMKDRMAFCVMAKRSARMIIAVHSTHQQHPAAWKRIISTTMEYASRGQEQLTKFTNLSAADSIAVLSHKKMQTYVESMKLVVELCITICACCIESMTFEDMATKAYKIARKLLMSMQQHWKVTTELPDDTIEGIILAAGKFAENNSVTYCELSLRPVAVEIMHEGGSTQSRMLQPYVESKGKRFLQTIVNIWKQDIRAPLPVSDGGFQ